VIDDESLHSSRVVVRESEACHDGEMDQTRVDSVLAAWREEGRWFVSALPIHAADTMENFVHGIRQFPGEGGVFGLVLVAEEFFLVVRVQGATVRAVVSDAMAVVDWSLVEEAMEAADVPWQESELVEFEPLGDTAIAADFGVDRDDFVMICTNEDTYPDEQLKAFAEALGCGPQYAQTSSDT
jgi:putative tRNA adenosine deaminase-associated protein